MQGIALLALVPGLYLARHLSTLYKLTHLRQMLSSWKLCHRLFFARRPKHEIDLILRQVNFQLGNSWRTLKKNVCKTLRLQQTLRRISKAARFPTILLRVWSEGLKALRGSFLKQNVQQIAPYLYLHHLTPHLLIEFVHLWLLCPSSPLTLVPKNSQALIQNENNRHIIRGPVKMVTSLNGSQTTCNLPL